MQTEVTSLQSELSAARDQLETVRAQQPSASVPSATVLFADGATSDSEQKAGMQTALLDSSKREHEAAAREIADLRAELAAVQRQQEDARTELELRVASLQSELEAAREAASRQPAAASRVAAVDSSSTAAGVGAGSGSDSAEVDPFAGGADGWGWGSDSVGGSGRPGAAAAAPSTAAPAAGDADSAGGISEEERAKLAANLQSAQAELSELRAAQAQSDQQRAAAEEELQSLRAKLEAASAAASAADSSRDSGPSSLSPAGGEDARLAKYKAKLVEFHTANNQFKKQLAEKEVRAAALHFVCIC